MAQRANLFVTVYINTLYLLYSGNIQSPDAFIKEKARILCVKFEELYFLTLSVTFPHNLPCGILLFVGYAWVLCTIDLI